MDVNTLSKEFKLLSDPSDIMMIFMGCLGAQTSSLLSSADNRILIKNVLVTKVDHMTKTAILSIKVWPEGISLSDIGIMKKEPVAVLITPKGGFFFRPQILQHHSSDFTIQLPDRGILIQRRNNFRYIIPKDTPIKLTFELPSHIKSHWNEGIFDLSVHGLSFTVATHHSRFFYQGLKLSAINFSIPITHHTHHAHLGGHQTIIVAAEVRHITRIVGKSAKIGVLFENIQQSDQDKILTFIFQESQETIIRHLK